MILEAIRMVASVLADGTNGVNAKIAALALDGPVAGGTDTRPTNIAAIKNQADHDLGIQAVDTVFPILIVSMRDDGSAGVVWTSVRDFQVPLKILYLFKSGSVVTNELHALYTYRAILRSIEAGMFAPAHSAARTRNSVTISKYSGVDVMAVKDTDVSDVVAGALTFHLTVRETSP